MSVRSIFNHELTKLSLFIFLSFFGAALLAPHLYGWGKDLAISCAPFSEDPNFWESPKVWLAEKCDSAKFSRYFNRALMGVAIVLLYPLIRSLRSNNEKVDKAPLLSRINPNAQGWKDIGIGIAFSAGSLCLLSLLLYQLGWIETDDKFNLSKAFSKAIAPAIIVSLLEEWLFRGVLFDVLRRQLSLTKTIISLSLFFAAVHFLTPPKGAFVSDPRSFLAGFEMLDLIRQKFLTPSTFIGVFLTLFSMGVILAYTRHKTGNLWLAISLHAGWVFSLKVTTKLFDPTKIADPILYNGSITDGLLPLLTLIVTGGCIYFYLQRRNTCHSKS